MSDRTDIFDTANKAIALGHNLAKQAIDMASASPPGTEFATAMTAVTSFLLTAAQAIGDSSGTPTKEVIETLCKRTLFAAGLDEEQAKPTVLKNTTRPLKPGPSPWGNVR